MAADQAAIIGLTGLMFFIYHFADRLESGEALGTPIMAGVKFMLKMLAFSLGLPLLGLIERFLDSDYPTEAFNAVVSSLYLAYAWVIIALLFIFAVYYLIIVPVQKTKLDAAIKKKERLL